MKNKYVLIVLIAAAAVIVYAGWQESSGPDSWENYHNSIQPPDKVMDAIGIKAGMVVGEIGAGRGRYAVRIAARVGEKGKVYANDILDSKLDYLKHRCKRDGISNLETIKGTFTDPRLPKGKLDLAFMINTYHHIEQPVEVLKNLRPALKPGGRLAIVEHTPKKVGMDTSHATQKKELLKQAKNAGYRLSTIKDFLVKDYIYILIPVE